jgi:hypothetical protein
VRKGSATIAREICVEFSESIVDVWWRGVCVITPFRVVPWWAPESRDGRPAELMARLANHRRGILVLTDEEAVLARMDRFRLLPGEPKPLIRRTTAPAA